MSEASGERSFLAELKRRRVIRVATLYVVAFWPIIQIVDILSPALGLSDVVMRYLILAFVGGFPIALILAWIFDFNRDGVVTTGDDASGAPFLGGRSEILLVGALLVVIAVLFGVQAALNENESVFVADEPTAATMTELVTEKTIAVLPFATFSDDPADQQFADGLTEELLNVLSRVTELRVAARTSSFAYKGVNRNITEIGNELKVATILEGSVRRNDVDDQIRVTAQLIDARTGKHYWSRDYTRRYKDIFQIQDDIARDVASELQITLLEKKESPGSRARKAVAPEAMVALKVARDEIGRRTEVGLRDAIRFYQKALEADPEYAEAWAGLADAYLLLENYGFEPRGSLSPKANEAIEKALALDENSGIAWASRGLALMQQQDEEGARTALEKAMELNPSYSSAFMWYAQLQDDVEVQLSWHRKAYDLDPRSPVTGYNVADLLIDQGRDHEAMLIFEQIVESDPYYHGAYELAARVNERRGRLDEAVGQYMQAFEYNPSVRYASALAQLFLDLGDSDSAATWIEESVKRQHPHDAPYIDWIRIQHLIVKGDREGADRLLRSKLSIPAETSLAHLVDAIYAAYYLDDAALTEELFTRALGEARLAEWPMHGLGALFALEVATAASHGIRVRGNAEQAAQIRTEVTSTLDDLTKRGFLHGDAFYVKALLAAEEGDRQGLLLNLQRAVDEGWRQHWRPGVEPILSEIREDTAFESLLGALATRMQIMRDQIQVAQAFDDGWGA